MSAPALALALVTLRRVRDELGEAVHTGLRKACDSDDATLAWRALGRAPDWPEAVRFAVDGLGVKQAIAVLEDAIAESRA